MQNVNDELVAMIERSVTVALANINDPRLNALPLDLLVVFVGQAATAQIMQSVGVQIDEMLQASKHGKQ